MSRKADTDSAGRKQPPKYVRRKRAVIAAKHRWKEKYQLEPGSPKSWSERSHGNKLRHLAAARKGGATTGLQIREQQRLFWRWYHGDCKAQLSGPFKTVVETFERIEVAHVQRYGRNGEKAMAWEGFFADMFRVPGRQSAAVVVHAALAGDVGALWERQDIFSASLAIAGRSSL